MAKFNWRALVGVVAPTLGTALGGPLGGMAGAVIAKAVMGKEQATEAELSTALANATPDQLLALKKADQDFATQMKSLDVDIFKLETADVQSARSLFAINVWPQSILSGLFVGGYFAILGIVVSGHVTIPVEIKDMATVLIGVMSASVTAIMSYWFGSSFGSREKSAMLAASVPANGKGGS